MANEGSSAPGTVFTGGGPVDRSAPAIDENSRFAYTDYVHVGGCIPEIPPILGNRCTGKNSVPAAVTAFETNAVNEVLTQKNLPAADFDTVKRLSRGHVVGQEWIDLAAIINKTPSSRSAGERLVYRWFQGVYVKTQQAQTQAAVDALKWSGLDMAHIDEEPNDAGYCNYQPPGGSDSRDFTWIGNQISLCHIPCNLGNLQGGSCGPHYPSVENFEQWGAYDVQSQGLNSPDVAQRLKDSAAWIGLSTTYASAPAGTFSPSSLLSVLGSDGHLNTTGLLLKRDVLPGILSLNADAIKYAEAVFRDVPRAGFTLPTIIASSISSVAALADAAALLAVLGPVVIAGAVIGIVVSTVLGSLQLAMDHAVHTTLVDALDQSNAALTAFNSNGEGPDLNDLMVNHGAATALFTLLVSQTVPDVSLNCVGWTTRCVEISSGGGIEASPLAAAVVDAANSGRARKIPSSASSSREPRIRH